MSSRIFDLALEVLPSGAIRLRQESIGEDKLIDRHPEQILNIIRRFIQGKSGRAIRIGDKA